MTHPHEIAADLLKLFGENGEGWTQRAFGRRANGDQCSSEASDAVQWCLTGALTKVNADFEALRPLLPKPYDNFINFNDNNDFATIKTWLTGI